jgi:hypothetical protein
MRMPRPNSSLTNAALRAGCRTRVCLQHHLADSSIEILDSDLPEVAKIAPRSLAQLPNPTIGSAENSESPILRTSKTH